jgi:hypothetical protein
MKEELQACFVTSCFQYQNPEKSGLNAEVSRNGHIYIGIHTTNGELVYLWPLRRNVRITSLWHLLFNFCFVPGCDSCCVFLLTLLLFIDVNVVRLLRLCSCNTPYLWFVLSLHWRHRSGIPCQTTMNQCASRGADQCHSIGSGGTCLKVSVGTTDGTVNALLFRMKWTWRMSWDVVASNGGSRSERHSQTRPRSVAYRLNEWRMEHWEDALEFLES